MFRLGFVPKDYNRVITALDRVKRTIARQVNSLPYKASVDCLNLLRKNIMTQKYGPYAPYNPRYKLWKEQYGALTGFWQLSGDLVNSLMHWRSGNNQWIAGIPSSTTDSGGKSWYGEGDKGDPKPIAMYARMMEFGGNFGKAGYHPPRSVFVPTLKEYEKDGLVKRSNDSMKKVKGSWR